MIYAASFAGEGAAHEATQLALELRRRYKMAAYVHSKNFDFTETVTGIGINSDRTPKKMKYKSAGAFDEYAVLVGNFSSVDDPNLQKSLKRIKHSQPDTLTRAGAKTTRRFAGLRSIQQRLNKEQQKKGPLRTAFATPNPIVPREAYAPSGVDQFVINMNKNVKYSLLKCPGKYTVRVATFTGTVVTNQQRVQEIENGGKMRSALEQAFDKANKLTVALRKRGVEAYEFHDRHESYVTVGSFDWIGQPRADGKQEINPAALRIMKQFGASQNTTGGARDTTAKSKRLEGISFDASPWPVEVPKRSIAADYATGRSRLR